MSRRYILTLVVPFLFSGTASGGAPGATLKPVSAFQGIKNREQKSIALFNEAGKVITGPRCLNCHPAADRPTQADKMNPHMPMVVRGRDGFGAAAMRCATCHQATNSKAAGVPGNPGWHLAPLSMAWQGKSLAEICEQVKDRSRNNDMDLKALVKHMSDDSLVGWAWKPGAGRTPAPGTQKQFGMLIQAWADAGAYCPKK